MRVLVVDDEAPARLRLTDLLRQRDDVTAITEADNGFAAVEAIKRASLDLVFLDVQMPELNGLEVLDAIGFDKMPLTVFVTAYDQHAIRAFEANALDYLLKPFSDERMEATLARAKTRLQAPRYLDRLLLKSTGGIHFVRVADIDWIEGAGVYVTLHSQGKELLHRVTLNELQERLDPERFIRVHRSAIVNIDSIVQLIPVSHGEFDVILKDGKQTRISRTYRTLVEQRLGQSL